MPRPCSICAGPSRAFPEEDLPKLNERLRSRSRTGETIAAIARELKLSVDALGRHAKHVDKKNAPSRGDDLYERLLRMQTRCDELYERAIATDDIRGATDVMSKLTNITDNLARLSRETGTKRMSLSQ
jgi:phage shock protein A